MDRLRNLSKKWHYLANPSALKGTSLKLLGQGQAYIQEPHALVITNCKILMCYSMLGISQQLLFASVMRPHYTLLD